VTQTAFPATVLPEEVQSERHMVITYSAEIEERIERLEAELTRSRAAYNQLSEDYNQLSQEHAFVKHLFEVKANTLTISHKASILATVRYLHEHKSERDEHDFIKLDGWNAASMAGQSYGTLMDNLGTLSREIRIHDGMEVETDVGRVPIFDRLVVRVPTTDRERYPQGYYLETYIKERDITYHPERYRPQTPIEWGGKRKDAGRKKCKKCGAMMKAKDHIRKVQREHICPNCGTHEWDEERRVSDEVLVNAPVEQPEASKNQLDFCSPDSLDDVEIEASKEQLEEVYSVPILPQVETGIVDTCPPAALRSLPIWCCWRYESDEKGRLTKVPYIAEPGRYPQKASSTDPATWRSYEQAQALYERSQRERWKKPFDGIGFMCTGDFTGADLDNCRNKETGEISEEARAIIARLASCTYVTPSDEGVRIIVWGKKPGPRCRWPGIELYDHDRFFTWGNHLPGTPDQIEDRQTELDAWYAELAPPEAPPIRATLPEFPHSCSDDEVLRKARNAPNGAKFRALYDDGSIAGYSSHSEADQALCRMLAYWADGDVSTIDRLFRQSKLYREKWERTDYRERTIRLALQHRRVA